MGMALLILNFFAYTAVPMFDAGDLNKDEPNDGFKQTSKIGIMAAIFGFVAFASV